MDVLTALTICGGAARRPSLAGLGIDDAALRRAVRAGVVQPCRGLYALPTADPGYVALLQRRQLLTCVSAAPFYGLWALEQAGPQHLYHRRGAAAAGESGHGGLLLAPHPHWRRRIPAGDPGPNLFPPSRNPGGDTGAH